MRPIDADALEKYLSDAEIEARRQRRYVCASALNTICGNVRNFPAIEPESCDDAVSRKWLLEAVEEGWIKFDTEEDYNRYIHLVRDIAPSVTPERKKGKWIERNPQNSDKCRLIECNQCGFSHIVGFNVPYEHWIENRNFCERCGADMRGGEE